MFGGFNDPFFASQQQHMAQMNAMMGRQFAMADPMMQNPLMPLGMEPPLALTDGLDRQRDRSRRAERSRDPMPMSPFGMMNPFMGGGGGGGGGLFGGFNSIMANMQQQMGSMQQLQNDPNSQFFSSSTVMSYSNTGDGPPKVYQATTATRQAPGGVRETTKSVKDSEAALEKMAVGRYIGDRGHVMERARNTRSGDTEQNEEYLNQDESDAPAFNDEWRDKTRHFHGRSRQVRNHAIHDGRSREDARYKPSMLDDASGRVHKAGASHPTVTGKAAASKKVKVKEPSRY